jgi:hypothetical protein
MGITLSLGEGISLEDQEGSTEFYHIKMLKHCQSDKNLAEFMKISNRGGKKAK